MGSMIMMYLILLFLPLLFVLLCVFLASWDEVR